MIRSKFVAGITTVIGVAGLVVGAWLAWQTRQWAATAKSVDGRVVRMVDKTPKWRPGTANNALGQNGRKFAPEVEYSIDGTKYQIQGQVSTRAGEYAIGQKVSVRYQPNKPADGYIDSIAENWLMPLMAGGFGLFFAVLGVTSLVLKKPVEELMPEAPQQPSGTYVHQDGFIGRM